MTAGMNASCEITCGEAFNVLMVRREAVTEAQAPGEGRRKPGKEQNPQNIVFAMRDGEPQPIPVETGISNYEYIEIKSGLAEGDEVIVRAKSMVMADREKFRERMKRRLSLPGVEKQTDN